MLRYLKISNAQEWTISLCSQLCVSYYSDIVPAVLNEVQVNCITFTESVISNDQGKIIHYKLQNVGPDTDASVGMVTIGIDN